MDFENIIDVAFGITGQSHLCDDCHFDIGPEG